ncbi:MAG: rhomboid family intramembrane serine protease [Bacteroidales bacterium]|nr:rhomboid family intramembrane serine protease [Bacteroidales bacterium]
MRNMPPVVKHLIIINVILFVATYLIGDVMYEKLALFPWGSPFFKKYQLLTHMFMHGGFWHIFFNMYTLYFFGCNLERIWGGKKFLLYYMVTGLGAALLHLFVMYLQNAPYNVPTVGASGAVYGLLLAFGMLFPNSRITMVFPIPMVLKAKWFVCIFGAIELITGIFDLGGGIAHFAHLGGMLFGLVLTLYWKKRNKLYTDDTL